MKTRLVEHPENAYVACLPGGGLIRHERDALELVGACGEYQVHRLLLHAENLAEDFYNLRSGLAGEVLQKFAVYSIKVAAVLPDERASQGRFGEMVLEANRSNRAFHVFSTQEQAVAWLVQAE